MSIDTELTVLLSAAKTMRDHADKLYELVPKANPDQPSFHPDNKDKNAAGWHGHEVNKYYNQVQRCITRIREGS